MKTLLFILATVALAVAALLAAAWLYPVAVSKAVWPLVESYVLREPFRGITADGVVEPGLFSITPTGRSTEGVRDAAATFLASLSKEQRDATIFAVDADEWRRWANIHISTRRGTSFAEMSEAQRAAAFALLDASLSARGAATARDIMRLEGHLADLMDDHVQYGEQRYWITVMGEPSQTEPWGWQIDGHHLVINFFVLGDQVVMTPTFMGSEPIRATSGRYAGTEVLQAEQQAGLDLINALNSAQRQQAMIAAQKTANNNRGELFQDNAVVPYLGLRLDSLDERQESLAVDLIRLHIGKLRNQHAEVHLTDILAHWSQTYLAWVGGTDAEAVFYYRLHSPVIMIEFDHQTPVALEGADTPTRDHVHTVIRTPNGNDYGHDLLRQHLATHAHH